MEMPEEMKDAQRIAIGNELLSAMKDKAEGENELRAAEEKIDSEQGIKQCLQELVELDELSPGYAEGRRKEVMRSLEGLLKGSKEGANELEAAQKKIDAAQEKIDQYLDRLTEL